MWATVQVLTSVRTTREQLLCLVNGALDDFLTQHGFHPSTPGDPGELLADYSADGDESSADAAEVPPATAG